jgi:hypothetical protein
MRLFVTCKNCSRKIILTEKYSSRGELRLNIGGESFHIQCNTCGSNNLIYFISDVVAENENKSLVAGAVIGGIIGFLGGPIGAIISGGIGAAIGGVNDTDEKSKVENFNNSI